MSSDACEQDEELPCLGVETESRGSVEPFLHGRFREGVHVVYKSHVYGPAPSL